MTDEASVKMGKRFNVAHEQKNQMIKAGFKNVEQYVVDAPLGTWNPQKVELGKCALLNMVEAVRYVNANLAPKDVCLTINFQTKLPRHLHTGTGLGLRAE